MNWDRIEGNWKQFKGVIKEKWGQLTDDEIEKMQGNREQFEGKLQEKYGIGKDQAKRAAEAIKMPGLVDVASTMDKATNALHEVKTGLTELAAEHKRSATDTDHRLQALEVAVKNRKGG